MRFRRRWWVKDHSGWCAGNLTHDEAAMYMEGQASLAEHGGRDNTWSLVKRTRRGDTTYHTICLSVEQLLPKRAA